MKAYQNYLVESLGIGCLKPRGWLARELKLQMEGITGELDENWGSINRFSDWLGGTNIGWERPPYWLDGLVPLAWLLGDEKRIEKARSWMEWTLNSQRENGDFGPHYWTQEFDETLFWPKFVMLKALVSYYEAENNPKVLEFMSRYYRFCDTLLDTYRMSGWDEARAGDFAWSVCWLYEKTHEEFLTGLLDKINSQSLNWTECLENCPFTHPTAYYYNWKELTDKSSRSGWYTIMKYHATHIVNVTMGLKQPVMAYKAGGEKKYLDALYAGMKSYMKYHGQVTGVYSGDEHLSGPNPTQGTELCSVVEFLFSLNAIFQQTGDARFMDLLERIAYNALPGTITEDFTGHQYDQQANQVKVSMESRNWYNNGDRANLFGFEPNFGCCLANMHQGWPKLTRNAFFMNGQEELVFGAYMPVSALWQREDGDIRITEETEYPFRDTVTIAFEMDEPREFTCRIRIPGWCSSARIEYNGEVIGSEAEDGYVSLHRVFENGSRIVLHFPMEITLKTGWYHNGMSVERGPLVYALNIKERWEKLGQGHPKFPDCEIYPESRWNYALDTSVPMEAVLSESLSEQPFSKENPPVRILAAGRPVLGWQMENNSAGDLPESPVTADTVPETVELVPYACTKLRISLFPWL